MMKATVWVSSVAVRKSGIDAAQSPIATSDIAVRAPASAPSHSDSRSGSAAMR